MVEVGDRVWAAVPLLSLLGLDEFPTYFFLMLWPIMIGGVMLRLFGEREQRRERSARASTPSSPSASAWRATCTTCSATR